ncbi:MAG TPA: amylo-alpha-1,6-glucosidase [Thermoanaerobaculia bacterium]|jgi:predicted glycogen debranching enzyme|nr:amylo-alpha-1,6-glucosidase [Thermoanaerobaculia bacterium]
MVEPARFMPWPEETGPAEQEDIHLQPLPERLLIREWLVANGLGGYASGSLVGVPTRRYHGLLVSALPAPLGRTLMLGPVEEVLHLPDGTIVSLGGERRAGQDLQAPGAGHLRELRLEWGLPVWVYEAGGFRLEKRVFLAHLQNTVHVIYRLMAGDGTARLELHPRVHFRPHDAPVSTPLGGPYKLTACEDRYELCSPWPNLPVLRLSIDGRHPTFTVAPRTIEDVYYDVEARRGYESVGDLWTPGFFGADLLLGEDAVALTASTEPWEIARALRWEEAWAAELERRRRLVYMADPRAHVGTAAELVLAADTFVVTPGRSEDAARAHAAGDEARSIIAGYHWFTDWGRDTMISLEGLTLTTGRHLEAGYILRTFARHVRDGLIPNLFPEGDREGLYHTADATLWYFHALHRYLQATGDLETLRILLPTLLDIVSHHLSGTRFGIGVDPEDGLLRQGAEGYQLTWMDAKVDDWVVTPRRGKAVEINALWYNALKLLEGWAREHGGETGAESARNLAHHAERCRESFNRRFWYAEGGYLYDVVDGVVDGEPGDDPACRPNQVFAIALDHPVLDRERWEPVLNVVTERLLTPVGLRSLAPGHPDYKPTYDGDLRSRDAAYHQGTVWGWLIGPYVDAWLKLHPGDPSPARPFLEGFVPHLGETCLGSISEVFDAEEPYTPRGCVAQAWSVAEVLRCWVKTEPAQEAPKEIAAREEEVVTR